MTISLLLLCVMNLKCIVTLHTVIIITFSADQNVTESYSCCIVNLSRHVLCDLTWKVGSFSFSWNATKACWTNNISVSGLLILLWQKSKERKLWKQLSVNIRFDCTCWSQIGSNATQCRNHWCTFEQFSDSNANTRAKEWGGREFHVKM